MTQRRSMRLVFALVVLAALAGGYWIMDQRQQAAEELRQVLAEVEAQLAVASQDRSSLGALLLRLNNLPDADRNPELIRVRARVRLTQGQFDAAWDLQAGLAEAIDAEAEDLWLGNEASAKGRLGLALRSWMTALSSCGFSAISTALRPRPTIARFGKPSGRCERQLLIRARRRPSRGRTSPK